MPPPEGALTVRRARLAPTIALLGAVALSAAACGSSSDTSTDAGAAATTTTTASDGTTTTSSSSSSSSPATGPTVAVADSSLGDILVDQGGLTLYLFTPDSSTESTCEGGCAAAWPPMDGPATAGDGVDASQLSTITRSDGSTQVSYAGHPLYTYASDEAPGDVEGQGLSGKWYVVSPSGEAISSSSGGGRSGY